MNSTGEISESNKKETKNTWLESNNLSRKIKRLSDRESKMANEHNGNEMNLTYHGGYSLGYLQGQLSVLHDVEDALSDHVSKVSSDSNAQIQDDLRFTAKEVKAAIEEEVQEWTGDFSDVICRALSDFAARMGIDVSKDELSSTIEQKRKRLRPA